MYLLDPQMGNRRRALIRDKCIHAIKLTEEGIATTWRDARNRAYGTIASLRSALNRPAAGDEVVTERVRSELGFLVNHPSSISVEVKDGQVRLFGPILANEVDRLLNAIKKIKGVRSVESRLEVYREPDNVPRLQGEPRLPKRGRQFELMQANWSPTARVLAGFAGGAMAYYGASRRIALGAALALIGLGLFARAATNLELKRLLGIGAGERAVNLLKTINLPVPRDRAFQVWTSYTDFPRFMRHVEEVRELADGRWRWTLVFPGGLRFHWNVVVTRVIPNQELAWRTEPDSLIQHSGVIKFMDNPNGSTAVHLRMGYTPPGGAIGHALAILLRADPKTLLDEELARMKSYIETGIVPHDVRHRTVGTGGAPLKS